jgi:hypothetical protein
MDQQMVYAAVIAVGAVLFILPTIVAAILGTRPMLAVIVLNATTWLGAWLAILMLPRDRPAPVRHAVPVRPAVPAQRALPIEDDPRYLYGAVRPADPAGAGVHQASAGAGAPVRL